MSGMGDERLGDVGLRQTAGREEQSRHRGHVIRRALGVGIGAGLMLIALRAGSVTPEEHASHHPGGAPAPTPVVGGMAPGAPMGAPGAPAGAPQIAPRAPMVAPAAPAGAPAMAGGGMGEMMGKMMAPANPGAAAPAPAAAGPSPAGGMGSMAALPPSGGCMGGDCGSGAAKTPIYPSLMTLPVLTPEKRAEIDALASQQINEGKGRLSTGAESLDRATKTGDNAAMQEAVGVMREGLDELGAGIAARRVLSEGKSPRNLALDWFKREMSLASPVAAQEPRGLLGIPPFHLFTMVLLIAFALAMVAMYFFKMRRASALFGRISSDSGKPPPGSSPPLGGASSPSSTVTSPAGKSPQPGGTPPSSKASTPSSPPAPQPGKSPATTVPPAGGAPPCGAPPPDGGSPASPTTPAAPSKAT